MANDFYICHECASKMVRDTRCDTVSYKENNLVFDQPGWYCTGCDEVVFSSKDAKVTQSAYFELRT